MLKDKHEIENYEEKANLLQANGWDTWYHDDNWINTEWEKQGKAIDRMGVSTDAAYSYVNNLLITSAKKLF